MRWFCSQRQHDASQVTQVKIETNSTESKAKLLKDGILPTKILRSFMHYVIHAYDHTDAGALDRRMAVRPDHLAYVRQLKATGQFLRGGALLDPEGNMIGSMLMLNLETEDELTTYLHTDPYIVKGVWDKIDVKPFRQADV